MSRNAAARCFLLRNEEQWRSMLRHVVSCHKQHRGTNNNGAACRDMPRNAAAGCFLPTHKETMAQNAMQCCGASFSCRCTKSIAAARSTMPQHKKIAVARNARPRHEEYGRGTNMLPLPSPLSLSLLLSLSFLSSSPHLLVGDEGTG